MGHGVLGEGLVGHVRGPGVPAVGERGPRAVVPLHAHPVALPPVGGGGGTESGPSESAPVQVRTTLSFVYVCTCARHVSSVYFVFLHGGFTPIFVEEKNASSKI